ncbi:thiol reductant ABC exporter subunit CydC [Aeromicrobium sp.]|uniref:thiol reductant ABC exporter subunit CydC n=1 Tax=Aeromicrobium sp. TaxID=1871063 RepID=UPI0019878704|nr:thiol reductant ABC exporter subunit CydC [Aeromicrobium sp.]MBC7631595.1 thiol reductant ABC exporter subunit CydC [Aeromicrobium sp.]
MRRRLVAGAVLGVLSQLCSVALLLTAAWLIVRAAEHPPVLYLMVAIVSVRFFGLGRATFRYAERLLTHDAALTAMTEQRVGAYHQLARVAPIGLPRQRRGDVVSRVVADVDAAQDGLLRIRLPWIYASASAACTIVLLALIEPVSGLLLALHVAACALFVRCVVSGATRRNGATTAELQGTLSADVSLVALSARDLVAYGAAGDFRRTIGATIDKLGARQRSRTWVGGLGSAFVLASTGVTIALLAARASDIPAVLVGVVLLAPVALLEPLQSLADAERLRPDVDSARRRLDDLSLTPTPVAEPATARPLPAQSTLVVDELSIGWDHTISRDISFVLDRGSVVGVSGPSGVGKSTLALTLLKLVEPRAGRVTLGGTDFCDLDGADIRTRVAASSQDDVLFDTTIRENLRIACPTASDDTMHAALGRAGMGSFVYQLPLGLETPIGEHGALLSGGERQRLSLARLIMSGRDVLIFDEPTEHLDEPTAVALMDDIVAVARDHAVLVISHSPYVLARCDRVVALHDDARPDHVGARQVKGFSSPAASA